MICQPAIAITWKNAQNLLHNLFRAGAREGLFRAGARKGLFRAGRQQHIG